MEIIWILLVIVICFVIILLIISQNNVKQQMFIKDMINNRQKDNLAQINDLKEDIANTLLQFQNMMASSIKQDLNYLNENTFNRLDKIENSVTDSLNYNYRYTNESFMNMMNQITKIEETQQNIKEISKDINKLQNVLSDKKSRGIYGELELYNLLENVFGDNEYMFAKQYNLSNGSIADAVISINGQLLVIDSKFPLENYNNIFDHENNEQMVKYYQNEFKKDVQKHIKAIASKYIISNETMNIAYMFVPAEAVFAYIYATFNDVIEYSYKNHVYIVSATTLMAYITALKSLMLEQKRDKKMKELAIEYDKLADEFDRFNQRYQNVYKDFDKLYKDMQSLCITTDKMINKFERISNVDLKGEHV